MPEKILDIAAQLLAADIANSGPAVRVGLSDRDAVGRQRADTALQQAVLLREQHDAGVVEGTIPNPEPGT